MACSWWLRGQGRGNDSAKAFERQQKGGGVELPRAPLILALLWDTVPSLVLVQDADPQGLLHGVSCYRVCCAGYVQGREWERALESLGTAQGQVAEFLWSVLVSLLLPPVHSLAHQGSGRGHPEREGDLASILLDFFLPSPSPVAGKRIADPVDSPGQNVVCWMMGERSEPWFVHLYNGHLYIS